MKKLLLLATNIFLLCMVGYGQETKLNLSAAQISDYLAEVYMPQFEGQSPDVHQVFTKLLNTRIYFRQEEQLSTEKYPKLSSVPPMNRYNNSITTFSGIGFHLSQFNPLRYNVDYFSNFTQVFRLDGTPYIMIILPQ